MAEDKALWMLQTEVDFLKEEFDKNVKKMTNDTVDEEQVETTTRVMLLLVHSRELLYRYKKLMGIE